MKCLMNKSYRILSRCLQWGLLLVLALGGLSGEAGAERDEAALMDPESLDQPESQHASQKPAYLAEFSDAVKAYREGNYIQARKALHPLHRQHPENSRVTYYLAITEAQLGRFQQAKKLYEEILALDPNSEAAQLALEGLKFLPSETTMDLPPRFQEKGNAGTAQSSVNAQPMPQGNGMQMPSPQEWMALQMMMGQNGLGGTGGMNAMPWMMQGTNPSTGGNSYGAGGFDPNVMSNMMMNQMLQNFTLSGDKDDNH
jgi:tetratricopeptide (TPR) repeat protein